MPATQNYTNQSNIPLSVAAFLAHDDYDYDDTTISATALLKPVRQLVLGNRVDPADSITDIEGLVASRVGTAVHDGIEKVWTTEDKMKRSLASLGMSQRIIDRMIVNPDPGVPLDNKIPVYLERRSYKEINGVRVSGKFDFAAEGRVEDFKTTSTFTYQKGTKDVDYIMQGSLYRWLNQDIIWQDTMLINFIFTDWKPGLAKQDNYPSNRVVAKSYPLKSVDETEAFVRNKLIAIDRYKDADERELPECSPKELWRSETEYKYYANPEKRQRATKNFGTDKAAAYQHLHDKKGKGIVIAIPGEVKACKYCAGFSLCTQKDQYLADGSLH